MQALDLEELALTDALTRTPLVLFAAYHVGRAFAAAGLPKISGYLFMGVVCGPQGLSALSAFATRRAQPAPPTSRPLLASCRQLPKLAAGQAPVASGQPVPCPHRPVGRQRALLQRATSQGATPLPALPTRCATAPPPRTPSTATHPSSQTRAPSPRPHLQDFRHSVLSITAAVTICTWVFVFPCVLALAPHISFLATAAPARVVAVASLAATLGCARQRAQCPPLLPAAAPACARSRPSRPRLAHYPRFLPSPTAALAALAAWRGRLRP